MQTNLTDDAGQMVHQPPHVLRSVGRSLFDSHENDVFVDKRTHGVAMEGLATKRDAS